MPVVDGTDWLGRHLVLGSWALLFGGVVHQAGISGPRQSSASTAGQELASAGRKTASCQPVQSHTQQPGVQVLALDWRRIGWLKQSGVLVKDEKGSFSITIGRCPGYFVFFLELLGEGTANTHNLCNGGQHIVMRLVSLAPVAFRYVVTWVPRSGKASLTSKGVSVCGKRTGGAAF